MTTTAVASRTLLGPAGRFYEPEECILIPLSDSAISESVRMLDVSARTRAARDPNTATDVLLLLATDEADGVRKNVASNPNTPRNALAALAHDHAPVVREAAGGNARAPFDLLVDVEPLGDEHNADVLGSAIARNKFAPEGHLRRLASSRVSHIRLGVAANPGTPGDLVEAFARSDDWTMRQAVACNPSAGVDTLAMLAKDPDADVRFAVAGHPSTHPRDYSPLMNDESEEVREEVRKRVADFMDRILGIDPLNTNAIAQVMQHDWWTLTEASFEVELALMLSHNP